mgnify:CR=1 FL=1
MAVTRYFLCILLLTLSLGVPASTQDDSQPDPHDLAYCTNHAGHSDRPLEEPHICTAMCDRNCDGWHQEKRGCLSYCRADHCHCIAEDCGPPDAPETPPPTD